MNYNSDLPGGKQVTKGDNKIHVHNTLNIYMFIII
jgi:hypothetical protein